MTKNRIKFDFYGEKIDLIIETYEDIPNQSAENRLLLKTVVGQLLVNTWGHFPDDFIEKHVLSTHKLVLAKTRHKYIGLVGMSIKNILGRKVYYVELLLVARGFQKSGLGSLLSFLIIRSEIFKNPISFLRGKSLEIFFITPNIRLLGKVARLASFLYPNPLNANYEGRVEEADEETWQIAKKIIEQSDNPTRILNREGLVLHGSYANTPWLIYNNDNAPWHSEERLNLFARKYLGYHRGEDKEFVVRAQINLYSIVRYLIS